MIRLYGEVEESIHMFLPALPLSQTVAQETDIDTDTVDLHYQGGFRDPLIEQIAWAIRAEMTDPAPVGKMLVETLTPRSLFTLSGSIPIWRPLRYRFRRRAARSNPGVCGASPISSRPSSART